jgi:hypothetical protein
VLLLGVLTNQAQAGLEVRSAEGAGRGSALAEVRH